MNCKQNNKGQVMLAAVLFIVLAALAVMGGTVTPVLRDRDSVRAGGEGKQSFYLAEAGVEDVAYRLKNGLGVSSSETITVGNTVANTIIADTLGGKTITAVGDLNNLIRRVGASLKTGDGISFAYAVQVGQGGFIMSNSSGVIGNIYSQGDVVGSNGAYVTGSVYAANGASLALDQANVATPPTNDITFGNANGTQDFAQSFQVSATAPLAKVKVYLKKVSTPGNLTIRLTSDNGGKPNSSSLDSVSLSASQVTANYDWLEIVFPGEKVLIPGNTYWLVLDGTTNSAKHYLVGGNTSYSNGLGKIGQYGGTWSNTSPSGLDGLFEIYLGGSNSTISGVVVGTAGVGEAWAHTVNNSTVAGNLYCVNGSGNNKACVNRGADPSPQPFPVSDGNIADWKADAAAGTTINGNYTVYDEEDELGPAVITGNLTISNGAVLTLTGTVYVQGNINVSNNAVVKLASGYGANGGILVTDGRISLSNNGTFSGSGQTGSYLLVVTTSSCPDAAGCAGNAIDVSNNAGTVILNAQKGTISFANNSGTKEATANKIILSNNATVTYDSGLANYNFLSGPTGGFDITGWGETQ